MMRTPDSRLLLTLALGILPGAGAVLSGAGCSNMYNGAVGIKPEDKKSVAAYNEFKKDQEQQLRMHQLRNTPAQFEQTSPAGASLHPDPRAAEQAMAGYASNASHPAMRSLGLYGQMPQAQAGGPRLASPMDSPDGLRQVSFATEGADFDPDVDPTGRWVVYASTRHRPTADLYLAQVGGTAVTQLTNDPGNDVMPSFSPDGKRIAFASDRSGSWDIYVMDTAGGKAVQLTSDPTHELHPSFSPDGKKIVYCSYGAQSGQWELVVIDVENPATKRFICYGLFPHWSPVDNRIVFQRARERGTRWFSVWTIEYENGEGVRPTEIAASSNAAAITPSWSPDGGHVVFCTVVNPEAPEHTSGGGTPAQADVWIVAADGSGRTNLTNSQFTNLQPVWSSDGTIYFVSNRGKDGIDNVWSLRPDKAIAVAKSPGSSPGWTPAAAVTPVVPQPANTTAEVPVP